MPGNLDARVALPCIRWGARWHQPVLIIPDRAAGSLDQPWLEADSTWPGRISALRTRLTRAPSLHGLHGTFYHRHPLVPVRRLDRREHRGCLVGKPGLAHNSDRLRDDLTNTVEAPPKAPR